MFRNPRENRALSSSQQVSPSVGRPPSPPSTPVVAKTPLQQATLTVNASPTMATRTMPSKSSRASKPKQTKLDFTKGAAKSGTPKPKVQPNSSILSFFKKTDGPTYDSGLFIEGSQKLASKHLEDGEQVGWDDLETLADEGPEQTRFNESASAVKRRKLSQESGSSTERISERTETPTDRSVRKDTEDQVRKAPPKRPAGPFLDDSETEDEDPVEQSSPVPPTNTEDDSDKPTRDETDHSPPTKEEVGEESKPAEIWEPPPLKEEPTSLAGDDGFAEFDGIEDFEEFEEGEELNERLFIQEQRRLEMAEAGIEGDLDDMNFDGVETGVKTEIGDVDDSTTLVSDAPVCPICNASLQGISDQDASVHVNNCLDGNPTPVPKPQQVNKVDETSKVDGSKKFQRPPRPAKPGQANPFSLDGGSKNSGSAFTKMMSGHAEDAAWANAAASENASRGKPAYQRTCPFYKILPGLFICVDAFRYGAVEGCNAYFLSHFHSDHYVGLTGTWSHGPIYCSKVTANLVKQQLRVDPKWVVALDWDTETEIPGTGGVKVNMIPANHCPGSSLFLFEKVVGNGKNPRKQRVLHCGDFRACRAHIEHPLLRPDVMDAVTGKTRQQKIDVCYLDTTYLNPKFAFPSQTDVIQACADMCVSLSKVRADETDGWEQMKRGRAGEGMTKFVRKTADSDPSDSSNASVSSRDRGKLLVVIGTYSIGKERICLGIARALQCKIFAPPPKRRIVLALEDPELTSLLTTNPREAQVHMTPLFEIRAETLDSYLSSYGDTFARAVGFRPTGWNYRPPATRFTEAPQVSTVLHSPGWRSGFGMRDLVPQRGSTGRAACFGVPYSEHSSFRELTVFCTALRVEKVVPTVNVGSAKSRERMKGWVDKWAQERKKGLYKLPEGEEQGL
ncbi:DNA repair metallo-beta-lactamase-domain-containing protein [Phyllosticta citrichinensis]|uniref:DNA repair metallo-beta-lactamase-domain-containing protein n=1 Tax=Phyllosticta citrichinensis TaxID=1130410 RepID=A0ABR1Y2V5_9PEZI